VTVAESTVLRGRTARGKYTLLSRYPDPVTLPVDVPTALLKRFQITSPPKKYTAKGTARPSGRTASPTALASKMNRKMK
jgi:hypothetical protein